MINFLPMLCLSDIDVNLVDIYFVNQIVIAVIEAYDGIVSLLIIGFNNPVGGFLALSKCRGEHREAQEECDEVFHGVFVLREDTPAVSHRFIHTTDTFCF
jgi:hypothetical protein